METPSKGLQMDTLPRMLVYIYIYILIYLFIYPYMLIRVPTCSYAPRMCSCFPRLRQEAVLKSVPIPSLEELILRVAGRPMATTVEDG